MSELYTTDFPELIAVPARSYSASLELLGIERNERLARLIKMDLIVKGIVDLASDPDVLGCSSPESITSYRISEELHGVLPHDPDEGLLACIDKAARILRGEMGCNPVWDYFDQTNEYVAS